MQNERPRLNLTNRAFQLAVNPGNVSIPMQIAPEIPKNFQDYVLLNNGDGFKYYSNGQENYLPSERLPFGHFVLLVIGSNNKRYPLHKDRMDRIYVSIKKTKVYLFVEGVSLLGLSLDQTTEFFNNKTLVLEKKLNIPNIRNIPQELPDFSPLTVDPLTALTIDLSRIRPVAQRKRRLTESQKLLQADETRRALEIYNDLQEENEDLENEHYAEFPLLKRRRNNFGTFCVKRLSKMERYIRNL